MALRIQPEIVAVLEAAEARDNTLTLTGQLDRKTYEAANKVLVAIGGKWDRKLKTHIFPEPVADVLDPILLTGSYTLTKQDFGQFDTPEDLAARVAREAQIHPGLLVVEPSAGVGNLVHGALLYGANTVFACEVDAKRCAALSNRFADLPQVSILHADFLTVEPQPVYDRVVMNPPFAKQADIDHVLHAFRYLAPGGRLVAIMSASVTFRTNAKTVAFREFVADRGGRIEPLPEGSFKESGTGVNTCLVVIDV